MNRSIERFFIAIYPGILNVIPAQAGIPSGLFCTFCFQIFAEHLWLKFFHHQIPAFAGMTNRVIVFTPDDFDKPECMCRCTQSILPSA
jgi:hypothetical protein